jgi:7-cyano-7-deazaguanine synthase
MELPIGDRFSTTPRNSVPVHASTVATVAVLYSGGLDSSILLAHLLAQGETVQPLYIAGGLIWEEAELAAARALLARLAGPRLAPLIVLALPLGDLYGQHWSTDGRQTPDATTPDEAVYLPGRNPLLLVKSRLWCQLNGVSRLALGTLKSNPFADSTAEFFASFAAALDGAMSGSVALERPFANYTKQEVMRLVAGLPWELTLSCLAPRGGLHCGGCNKCHERKAMFAGTAVTDPTHYAAATATKIKKHSPAPSRSTRG